MPLLQQLAEARIRQAMEAGELDDLPGRGKPLRLDDDRLVPESLRMAYRLLKNAGYAPPEIQLRSDIADARSLLALAAGARGRHRALRRLDALYMRLAHARGGGHTAAGAYRNQLLERLDQAESGFVASGGSSRDTPSSSAT